MPDDRPTGNSSSNSRTNGRRRKALKECTMHYKTVVFELLQERPKLLERMKRSRTLHLALERYTLELKTWHETWKDRLFGAKPGSDESQIASEALEFALIELRDFLDSMSESLPLEEVLGSSSRRPPRGQRRPRNS
jgi:hypothetical protein